jgi:hypothetical protein
MNRFVVTGTNPETGMAWTYWETFATQQEAVEAAERFNNARKPIARDCCIATATADQIERASRNAAMLKSEGQNV